MRRILQSGQTPIRPISWHEWVPTWTYSQASYVQTLPRIHEIIMSIRPTPRNPTLPCRDGGVLHRCNPCEIGGRWNDESLRLVAQLVRSRALRAPAPLRGAATQGWYRRWWGLLSVAVQNTLAATLLGSPPVHALMPGAQAPPLQDVLHDACPPVPSCLPAR